MLALRTSLRRGSVWVSHSQSFREREKLMIPADVWLRDRARNLDLLGQATSPE